MVRGEGCEGSCSLSWIVFPGVRAWMPSLLECNVPMEQSPETSGKHGWFSSVQSLSCVWLFATPWTATCQAFLSITNSQSLLIMTIMSVMPSNHLILCCPHLLLPSIFPSIRVFPMSQLFVWGGQSIGISASASVLPMNIQDWFPLQLTGLISLQSKGLSWDSKFKCESEIEALFIRKS